jgi:Transposase DDE domain.
MNLARIKFIAYFIQALCKVQTVTFEKLGNAFDTTAKATSSLRRIQRFIASFDLPLDCISRLIFRLIPHASKVSLTIDRTNWKFGALNINILMLGVVYQGVAFPLMFSMLPKQGNSNSRERIDLLEKFIALFGLECIESLMADREFIGLEWLDYLNRKNIRYYIRIRNNFKVYMPHRNKEIKAWHLFNQLDCNQFTHYPKIVKVNGVYCYLSGCKIKNDFLIIISFNKPEDSLGYYQQRWQIEMCFRALKSSGFDLENTHLVHLERIEKLLALVMIAFVWCYKVGIYLHAIIPIKIKAHGRKAKSIFKYGLNHIAQVLLNSENKDNIGICGFLSCT